MTYEIKSEGTLATMPPIRAVRFCSNFALKIYEHCRYAVYLSHEKHWIVPKDFGQLDFLKLLGHELDPFGNLYEGADIPGLTCLDMSDWVDQYGAAGRGRVPSWALFGLVVAAVMAFV
jgi:hypothetical protein